MRDFQFEKDQIPLWQYLGLTDLYTVEEVINAYELMTDEQKRDEKTVFAWKSLSDPMYAEMYRVYQSITALEQAGFFVDSYPTKIQYETNFLSTPYEKVVSNISREGCTEKPYIVILTTGSFSPIHKGHINLMEMARNTMEEAGYKVVGGYISPSHDGYVSKKDNGRAALDVEKRSLLIETSIKESDWLYLDKWEGYYNNHPINFTDVIYRLEAYLNKHISTFAGIKVCYVFGGDNAAFGRAFLSDCFAVCVHRNGADDKFTVLKEELSSLSNVFFVEDNEFKSISSTAIRNGFSDGLQDEMDSLYRQFLLDNNQELHGVYGIRNDLEYAFPLSEDDSNKAVTDVINAIMSVFERKLSIDVIASNYQEIEMRKRVVESQFATISIDAFVRGDYNLDLSRLFEMSTMQLYSKGITNRPFTPSLEQQVSLIPPGEYLLIEDDVASGKTLKEVYELLSPTISIKELLILSSIEEGTNNKSYFDIIDMRDFVFGSANSGLVTTLPNGEIVRVPYVLPYVSPISRASIPVGQEREFSIKIWEVNRRFFSNHPRTLGQMDPSLIVLMKYIGFHENQSMVDIAQWHISHLKGDFLKCQDIHLHHGQQKETLLRKAMDIRLNKKNQERLVQKHGKRLMSNMKLMPDSLPHRLSC